jgi:hypothetical protein
VTGPAVDPIDRIVAIVAEVLVEGGVANGAEIARNVFKAPLEDPDQQAEYEAEVAELLARLDEDQDGTRITASPDQQ